MATVEARRYKFTNITKDKTVHVKELRKALSPGRSVEWEGVLTDGSKRLKEQKLLGIDDLGPGNPNERKDWVDASRKKMAKQVQDALAKQRRRVTGGSASPVKMSDDVDGSAPKPEVKVENVAAAEPVKVDEEASARLTVENTSEAKEPSRLDNLFGGGSEEKPKKKKK